MHGYFYLKKNCHCLSEGYKSIKMHKSPPIGGGEAVPHTDKTPMENPALCDSINRQKRPSELKTAISNCHKC